ncbi:hypothetical protein FSP39_004104 [Pinctada imbricata]|uniref:Uncharacterized protein n=1 Tax=Pinctada imbricata TaxID=66713 RepID=A0AA88YKR1_PINIB|nr:hypothetical protein FSP39_004104 [Pinctada imbricata]
MFMKKLEMSRFLTLRVRVVVTLSRNLAVVERPTIIYKEKGNVIQCKNALAMSSSQHLHLLARVFSMSVQPPTKKFCSRMKIATHNGSFHCDEVLACYLLRRLPEYKDAEIVRTRNPELIDSADIVVDVGGVFDASKKRFDHHQRTFSDTMNSLNPYKKWTTKLSSAGLIYCHFGQRIVADILELKEDDPVTGIIFDKVYENFVEEIDAIDNGVNQYDGEPKYHISTTISSRVGNLNPLWNEDNVDEMVCITLFNQLWIPDPIRLSILEEWRGLRDSALSEKSGIPGCIFVHASGFIGGNDTYEGVLQMAKLSLKQQQSQ